MSLQIGNTAPDFKAQTTSGEISFYDWLGKDWGILFSHPADYTPVCATELGEVARLKEAFDSRNTKVIALSVDSLSDHFGWIKELEASQKTEINFPIIADQDRKIAQLYGMIHPEEARFATVRSVFIIGPDKRIKLTLHYPISTGRNFNEILRVLDSLQLTRDYSVATPVNWQKGEDTLPAPKIGSYEVAGKFGSN